MKTLVALDLLFVFLEVTGVKFGLPGGHGHSGKPLGAGLACPLLKSLVNPRIVLCGHMGALTMENSHLLGLAGVGTVS